jgi:hypothetical protein
MPPPLPPGELTGLTNPIFTGFFDHAKVNKGLTRVNRVNIFGTFTTEALKPIGGGEQGAESRHQAAKP